MFQILQKNWVENNMKKIIISLISLVIFTAGLFAANDIPLLERSKNSGMTIYWDSLSETGMIEKNGHQLSFRNGERMVLLDSIRMMITDAPELRDNQLYVSKKFLDDSEEFFNQKSELPFKVGAILIDAGHGGKDPGALKTYKINGKNVTIQEKDITLKVSKMLAERLKAAYPGKQIILTRSTDKFLTLGERTDIANGVKVGENEAVLFISVHVNSSLNRTSSGYEVWYLSPGYRRNVLDKSAVDGDENLFPVHPGQGQKFVQVFTRPAYEGTALDHFRFARCFPDEHQRGSAVLPLSQHQRLVLPGPEGPEKRLHFLINGLKWRHEIPHGFG